jgi:hypothetical protein
MSDETNFCNTKNTRRGRPRLGGDQLLICIRFRAGRSEEEDRLFERLQELAAHGQRSRYIRRVLLTGDVEPVLDSVFQEETARVRQGLDAMFDLWDDDGDD